MPDRIFARSEHENEWTGVGAERDAQAARCIEGDAGADESTGRLACQRGIEDQIAAKARITDRGGCCGRRGLGRMGREDRLEKSRRGQR